MSLNRVFILLVLTFSFDPKANEEEGNFPMPGYLIIIPRERVGYEMANSQGGVESALTKLISNNHEWNNCKIKFHFSLQLLGAISFLIRSYSIFNNYSTRARRI